MQLLLLPGSLATAEELWQQCLSGDCTDLVLCCDDGIIKTHKAILVFCLPWLTDTDTDTVIMPGISVEKLKEAIKEFYLTSESKATLWYFCALFKPILEEQGSPTDGDVKMDQDGKKKIDKNDLQFVCKIERDEVATERDDYFEESFDLDHVRDEPYDNEPDIVIDNGVARTKVNRCKLCKKIFQFVSEREKHMVDIHGVIFDCDICGCKLSTTQSAGRHKRLKHPDLFKIHCDFCGCGFNNEVSRDKHVKKCDELGNKEKNQEFMCSVCGNTLASKAALKAHISTVHDPQYGTHKCNVCGKFYAREGLLRMHKKIQHEGHNSFPCEICGKVLSRPKGLKEHIKSVHDKLFDKICPHCDYRSSNNKSLKKHIDSSHLGITYSCEICNMVFTQQVNLIRHKSVHSDERPFVCDECGTGFKKKNALERHLLSIHSTTSFPCSQCGKMFKSEAYLASHMRAHDESSQFPCQFCTRKFVTRTKLRMHINTHTGETPYKCPHNCGKAFHSSDQLSHHKKQCKELILNK